MVVMYDAFLKLICLHAFVTVYLFYNASSLPSNRAMVFAMTLQWSQKCMDDGGADVSKLMLGLMKIRGPKYSYFSLSAS